MGVFKNLNQMKIEPFYISDWKTMVQAINFMGLPQVEILCQINRFLGFYLKEQRKTENIIKVKT